MRALPLEFRMAWATRLRQAMDAKKLKAEELATATGRSLSIIYRWMSGQIPELPDVKRLADILDRDPAWLIWGDDRGKVAPPRRRPHPRGRLSLVLLLGAAAGGLWPSPSVAATPHPLSVGFAADTVHLIGRWRVFRNRFRYLGAGTVYA